MIIALQQHFQREESLNSLHSLTNSSCVGYENQTMNLTFQENSYPEIRVIVPRNWIGEWRRLLLCFTDIILHIVLLSILFVLFLITNPNHQSSSSSTT